VSGEEEKLVPDESFIHRSECQSYSVSVNIRSGPLGEGNESLARKSNVSSHGDTAVFFAQRLKVTSAQALSGVCDEIAQRQAGDIPCSVRINRFYNCCSSVADDGK
jgi:hypothetical protein